jgi:Transposase DDE domain group 1
VRLLHSLAKTHATFDDPNLVSHSGLVPVMALAERAGLGELTARHVRPAGPGGVNAAVKVGCLVAGMAAGADSIDDLGLLRHGAMSVLFGGIRAPSTLGSHLRAYTWGHVSQLEKVHREFLAALARQVPLLPGAGTLAFVDIDSTQKRVYGYRKQGARFGYAKVAGRQLAVRGLNALAAAISTPLAAPVIAATRLRGGNAASARGAASFAAQAVRTARACGCTGTIVARMDSAYYAAEVLHAIRRAGARFSVTVPQNSSVRAAIAAVPGDAWTAIRYPRALWDEQLGCWISEAEVAEVPYTAFTGIPARGWQHDAVRPMDGRLIIRRVHDQNTAGKMSCSPSGGTTRSAPTPRSPPCRPRASTATTRSSSRSSPTATTGRWPTCHQASSPPTPPGSPAPPSRTTCCARPGPWPAAPAPGPAAPPSAAT